MNNKWFKIGGVIIAMAITATVQAVPITGGITISGSAILNGLTVGSSTTVTSWGVPNTVQVGSVNGSFGAILPGSVVTMPNAWIFGPQPGIALNSLWSVGGFTFNFLSDTVSASGSFLNVAGYGIIQKAGFTDTPFYWNFSTQDPSAGGPSNPSFTFAASTQSIPDGGTTAMMLGIALSGVALLKKKLTA